MISLSQHEFEDVITGEAVLMFGGSHCMACKMVKPKIEELEKELPHIKFVYIESEQYTTITEKHNVNVLPTFIYYKYGVRTGQHQGALTKERLKADIDSKLSRY